MAKKTTKGGSGAMKMAMLGASLAGLAAAYFFTGTEGKKRQKHAKAWAIKMKGDVVERLETAREVSEPVYHKIIDTVAAPQPAWHILQPSGRVRSSYSLLHWA